MESAIIRLLLSNPYYAYLIMQFKRVYVAGAHEIQTAAVSLTKSGAVLYVNLDFFNTLSSEQQEDVLIHECWHIMALHPVRAKEFKSHKAFNIAADKAINQNISGMKKRWEKGPITPVFPQKGEELGRAAEAYYNDESDNQESGFDFHGPWSECDISEAHAKELVKSMANKAMRAAAGSIPSNVAELIEALGANKVGWRALLRQFIARSEEYRRVETRSRRNRRFGLLFPGKKNESLLHVAAAVDTSGSVSNKELGLFLTELNSMHASGVCITLIEADADVQRVSKYTPKNKIELNDRGGTLYNPALLKAKEERADIIIYFGDMDAADIPKNPGIPTLWISSRGKKAPASFGKTIFL